MKTLILYPLVLMLAVTAGAEDAGPDTFGKAFLQARFDANREALNRSFADKVLLLAGHEYLKKQYGLNPDGDRGTPLEVAREQLVELDVKTYSARPAEWRAKIKKLLAQAETVFVTAKQDGMKLDPRNPKNTTTGKWALPVRKGDVVMLVLPEGTDDFLLYTLRKIGGAWKVVMDYTD